MRAWVRWSAWLCLGLMFWAAGVESTHQHPKQTKSASCVICVVAHSTNPTPNSANTTPSFASVGLLHDEAVVAHVRLAFADLANRGPPAL